MSIFFNRILGQHTFEWRRIAQHYFSHFSINEISIYKFITVMPMVSPQSERAFKGFMNLSIKKIQRLFYFIFITCNLPDVIFQRSYVFLQLIFHRGRVFKIRMHMVFESLVVRNFFSFRIELFKMNNPNLTVGVS